MSTYVIGDVQGCCKELEALLSLIHFNADKDRLWFVGDLVNRGPDSLGVLRLIKQLSPVSQVVLGNHDLHLLAVAYNCRPLKASDTFADVLAASDSEDLIAWLQQQPLLHYDAHFATVMTHAGIYPYWSLSQAQIYAEEVAVKLTNEPVNLLQSMYGNEPAQWDDALQGEARLRFIINAFTRMRYVTVHGLLDFKAVGPLGSQSSELVAWFELVDRLPLKAQLVFGHWASLAGELDQPGLQALDTGCVWGGALTALRLEDNQRFKVNKK